MKRYDTPLLGSHGGATVRMEGPQAPLAVFRPRAELERIRNPFLPPDSRPEDPVEVQAEAEFANARPTPEPFDGRESVWSIDSISRRVTKIPTSGRMIAGSFAIFAVLGAGGFAALYSAVHADDATNRARYAADESRATTPAENATAAVPTMPAPALPEMPAEPAAPMAPPAAPVAPVAPAMSSQALGANAPALPIASGTAMHGAAAVAADAPGEARRAVAPPPPAVVPARIVAAPARRATVVVHVEPAPVPFIHHETDDKDGPISEDALLAGSAHAAPPPVPSNTAPSNTAPSNTAPSNTAPSNTAPSNTAPSNTAPSNTPPSNTPPSNAAPSSDSHGADVPGAAPSASPDPIPPSRDNPNDPRM